MQDHHPPEATSQQTYLDEELKSAIEAKQRQLATIREANRRHGIRHADLVLVCDLPAELQALNSQYQNLEWQIEQLREEVQSRVVVRPDGETIVLPPGHSFAEFSEDGKVISGGRMTIVYDEDYEAADHARHMAQRAKIIEQYGSVEAYDEHCRAETQRMRAGRREAFRHERIRRNRTERLARADASRAFRRLSPQRNREHRPGTTRRTASSSSTSAADPPPDADADGEPSRRRREPRHVSLALSAFLRSIGGIG